ncbi:unnamed protein product [Prorocentrum cordatum]|uniref:Uncharacterized protein n=1 Tax=Prorocentrum cordatum TaxID=2364126 RepID=A0ABN9X720_9DINO|nr:unnamed protein product [Polarella glacialis]
MMARIGDDDERVDGGPPSALHRYVLFLAPHRVDGRLAEAHLDRDLCGSVHLDGLEAPELLPEESVHGDNPRAGLQAQRQLGQGGHISGCRHKVAIQTMSACHPKSVLKKSAARNSTAAERPARPRAPARARAASAAPCRASTSSRPRQSRSSGKATAEHRAPSAAAQVHEHLPGLRGDSPR